MTQKRTDESRAKFLVALEKKKKQGNSGTGRGPASGSKVGTVQDGSAAAKKFQRKSGAA